MAATDIARELDRLEADLRRLEAEYNMFFAGRAPKPPWETRSRVETAVTKLDRRHIQNYGDRFRFETLQSRLAAFVELWDRGLRSREEGRSGPFAHVKAGLADGRGATENRVLNVTAFRDPTQEGDKLRDLYDSFSSARQAAGENAVPFQRFAEIVKTEVRRMQAGGEKDVAFRVAVEDGKVTFTAKTMSGEGE